MTYRFVTAPVLDRGLYPAKAILPLVQAAAAADPCLEYRQTEAGLHLVLAARERTEGEQCLSELLTRLTEAAMEALLLTEPSRPGVPSSTP